MVNCPLNKKKKKFINKKKDFSDNKFNLKYKKKQNTYLIYQAALADYNNNSNSKASGKKKELDTNYNIAC